IPIFTKCLIDDQPVTIFGDGEQTRDFVNVQDVVRANILAARTPRLSGVFNIGSGRATTVNKLVAMLQDITGREAIIQNEPRRRGDVIHSQADVRPAAAAFGYRPSVKLREGLIEYAAWCEAPDSFIHRSELQLWSLPG